MMLHPVVQKILEYGYSETAGEEIVNNIFQNFLRVQDKNEGQVKATDANVSRFLDFFLEQYDGGVLADTDEEEEPDPEAWERPGTGDEDVEQAESLISGEQSDASSSSDGSLQGVRRSHQPRRNARQRHQLLSDDDEDADADDDPGGELDYGSDIIEDPDEDEDADFVAPANSKRQRLDATPAQPKAAKVARTDISAYFKKLPLGAPPEAAYAPRQAAQPCSVDAPRTADEEGMDLLDFVNWKVFGNTAFREQQRRVIEAVLQGRDVFVLMPTGGGKSLCYQLPAVISPGLTIVISPLLSLMQDQVKALVSMQSGGVPTSYLNSQQTERERRAVFDELRKPRPTIKLLYVTPEQLVASSGLNTALQDLQKRQLLARFVVDEAHCVSAWGHDFRPDYKQIGVVKATKFPRTPLLALTATATDKVKQDVIQMLRIQNCPIFTVSFFRSNLVLRVVQKPTGKTPDGKPAVLEALVNYIKSQGRGASGIVYVLSRDDTAEVASYLKNEGEIATSNYHAGLTPKQRIQIQNQWRRGEVQVVVATIAFGMGIDKPDVRFVVHYCISKSIEGYYQEAGRAGRDGKPSECVLLFAARDIPRIVRMLRTGRGKSKAKFDKGFALLNQMKEYCADDRACRHSLLLAYFGERFAAGRCGNRCDNCVGPCADTADLWQDGEDPKSKKAKKAKKKSTGSGGAGRVANTAASSGPAGGAFVRASSLLG